MIIISYPTEIRNDNYARSKIEFNYCLLLKKKSRNDQDIGDDIGNLASNPSSLGNFDDYTQDMYMDMPG
jgi:hypothetical protein